MTAATWYILDGDHILVNLDNQRARLGHLRRDPRVTLTVLADNWYTHVTVIGRVVELRDDVDLADIDRISRHYTGNDYPVRDNPRTTAVIEVERWYGWGELKDNDQPSG